MLKEPLYEELGINVKTKRTKRYLNAGLLNDLDKSYVEDVNEYWEKNYKKKIDPAIHVAFYNLSGKKDSRIVPAEIMWKEIIPYFNDRVMTSAYRDKNLYDIMLKLDNSVETVIKRVRGNYYNAYNEPLNNKEDVLEILLKTEKEYIIKPSDSNNGLGIKKLVINNNKMYLDSKELSLRDLEKDYDYNFSIQKVISQSENMAAPHPQSVNTLRMVTLRWKNKIHYLLTFARFGSGGAVKDNAGTGGVCLGVEDDGSFLQTAIDENCSTYSKHPTTGFDFSKMKKIENFSVFKSYVVEAHKQVLHHDFISWDIAVDRESKPVFIEANFAGATWLYQLAAEKPLFGDLTEEILHQIVNDKENNIKKDVQIRSKKKKRNTNKKLLNDIKDLESKIRSLEVKLSNVQSENIKIKESKSWKLTSPLRKLKKEMRK